MLALDDRGRKGRPRERRSYGRRRDQRLRHAFPMPALRRRQDSIPATAGTHQGVPPDGQVHGSMARDGAHSTGGRRRRILEGACARSDAIRRLRWGPVLLVGVPDATV